MKRVVITGATGFIGRALCKNLCKEYKVIALSRDVRRAAQSIGDFAEIFEWDGRTTGTWIHQANDAFAELIWQVRILHQADGTSLKRREFFTADSILPGR